MRWLSGVVRWWILIASTVYTITIVDAKEKDCALDNSGVYVSISSEAEFLEGSGYLRSVEVNWFGMTDFQEGDMVGLWTDNPEISPESLIEIHEVSDINGKLVSKEIWNGSLVPSAMEAIENSCLPYWAGYQRDGLIIHSSCLMIRPHWMTAMREELSDVKISEIALPGTHDAGASGHFATILGSLVGRWTFTQDESFWQMLVFGIRYLDVRIAYYPSTEEKIFINHGEIRIAPLQMYLDDIVSFMWQTEEIVIFDIHALPHGFSGYPEREEELIAMLEMNFIDFMVPKSMSPNPSLRELWESNKRLIVTYPKSSTSEYLWNTVHHLWGDVDNLNNLKDYMDQGIPQQSGKGYLWSAMTEFTPSVLDVTLDRWGGLRGAAAITNTPVTQWYRNEWWNMVNIVAMDFFLSSDVVSVTVQANQMRYTGDSINKKSLDNQQYQDTRYEIEIDSKNEDKSNPRTWLVFSAPASATFGQPSPLAEHLTFDSIVGFRPMTESINRSIIQLFRKILT